jgi:hypothetical protein
MKAVIADYLLPAIKERFPEQPFVFGKAPEPAASLKSPCLAVGGLQICDDGNEITVYLMNATHSHFSCYDEGLSDHEKAQLITSDVIQFLDKLLKDGVVVWRAAGGMAGGCYELGREEKPPVPSMLKSQFVWSREIR